MTKVCPRCKEEKDIEQFGKNKLGWDGHQAYCRLCMNKTTAKYRTTGYRALCERYGIRLGKNELKQIVECREWNKKYYTNLHIIQ